VQEKSKNLAARRGTEIVAYVDGAKMLETGGSGGKAR
jgi:hypothetical protein